SRAAGAVQRGAEPSCQVGGAGDGQTGSERAARGGRRRIGTRASRTGRATRQEWRGAGRGRTAPTRASGTKRAAKVSQTSLTTLACPPQGPLRPDGSGCAGAGSGHFDMRGAKEAPYDGAHEYTIADRLRPDGNRARGAVGAPGVGRPP